nr:hypothetical protein [Tanacetum cinerariifolium]
MVAYLSKSDAGERFNQIIDFLNGSSIKYALTVNPKIYVSCIKQFWTTVTVKQVNDVTRLQDLVDKKKEIFAELARMGYEMPSIKITFYKAFFSSQWNLVRNVDSPTKFYMYPHFPHLMIRKQVGDLSTHTNKYTSPALTQKVFANKRRVGKGFSEVETPLFESMLVEQQVTKEGDTYENVEENHPFHLLHHLLQHHNHLKISLQLPRVEHLEFDKVAQALEITKLKRRVKKLERRNKVRKLKLKRLQRVGTSQRVETSNETMLDDVSNQGRMIAEVDDDLDVVLENVIEATDEVKESAQDEGRQAESKAEIYKIDMDHANKVLSIVTAAPSRRRKGVVIRDPEEESTTSIIIPAETKSKDKGKGILVEEPKPLKKKQQIKQDEQYARELQAELNKNIDWDEAIDHTKEKIEEDENRALKRLNETPSERAAKRQKLDEEFRIVPNEDDDIYTEATLLARNLVKERFSTTMPKNFFDDFLLVTLGAMFEKPDIHAQIWKTQRNVHCPTKVRGWKLLESCGVQIITFTSTQLILLVKRKYPLTRFTFDQMLNAVRLEVEEESEVSLELLRFTRQQHQEGQLE